jgi:hypothetical protein
LIVNRRSFGKLDTQPKPNNKNYTISPAGMGWRRRWQEKLEHKMTSGYNLQPILLYGSSSIIIESFIRLDGIKVYRIRSSMFVLPLSELNWISEAFRGALFAFPSTTGFACGLWDIMFHQISFASSTTQPVSLHDKLKARWI